MDKASDPGLVVSLTVLGVALCFSLLVTVPLTGALVRFRANFNPKSLQLDAEGGATFTGPVVNTYFGMLRRVYQIEGWNGLYKGLMPTLISSILVSGFIVVFLGTSEVSHNAYNAPTAGVFGTFFYALFAMIVSLPASVITYRAITTPHKLSYFALSQSLRVLLTPTERRQPWIVYQTPGLFLSKILHIAYIVLGIQGFRRVALSNMDKGKIPNLDAVSPVLLGIYFTFVVLSTAVLCPLEVIATRLAIQRNHASAEFNSVGQEEEGDAEEVPEYSGTDEDVMGLRSEGDPYCGLVDTAKRILEEEGVGALYRGWWLSLLGCLAGAFA